ncbi:uncharacterized protein LOC142179325 [Nicotiana tabacum]|uniref:Uncharacterized protein LOC142179325 n=1 Tax=Nicotiana tabacum TaxID=4097 RepID=A0AC58U6K3_TOBAC
MVEDNVQVKRPFKFFNCLANHQKFEEIVKHCWKREHRGNKMQKIWYKLKAMKGELKKLNNQEYKSVGDKIKETQNKLTQLQQSMQSPKNDSAVIDEEKKTKMELAKWMEVKEKHARNHIGRLTNNEGHILHNTKEVEEEILQFYKTLLGTTASALPVVNPDIIRSGNMLSREQQLQIIKLVTKEEVLIALKGIDDSKAPGCD